MKVARVEMSQTEYVETNERDSSGYRRNGPDDWEQLLGESWESAYPCNELEAAYQLFIEERKAPLPQLTIIYTASGAAISDFALEGVYSELATHGGVWECSTENLFNRVRLGVARGEISPERVTFRFDDQDIRVSRDGDFSPCPEGFLSLSAVAAREIMIRGAEIRMAKKE